MSTPRPEDAFACGRNDSHCRPFDYRIMKSGVAYNRDTFYGLKRMYDDHRKKIGELAAAETARVTSKNITADYRASIKNKFHRDSAMLCSDLREACDIVLDICYQKNCGKQFAWDIVQNQIIDNSLEKSGWVMRYPACDPDGDIEFRGRKYAMKEIEVMHDELGLRRITMADDSIG